MPTPCRYGCALPYVGDRGDEGARGHRRIGPHPLQHHRNQDAAERAGDQIAHHRKADHDAERGNLEPGHRGNAGDDGECEAVDKADQAFAHHHAKCVVGAEFAGRQRADRDRHGLGRGIAALAGDDRRQHRQRHHLLELALEQAQHRGRQKGGGQIDQQPVEAAPGDGPDVVG
jgi:hypothetical protein